MGVKNVMADEFTEDIKNLQQRSENKENEKNDIHSLKAELLDKMFALGILYPEKIKPPAVKALIDSASGLYSRARATLEDIKFAIESIDEEIDRVHKAQEEDKEQALKLAEEQAKETERALKKVKSGKLNGNQLKRLANQPPAPDTHKNLFRPDWAYYDYQKDTWKLDTVSLSELIVTETLIKRVQENGILDGYLKYTDNNGSWRWYTIADVDYLINSYFKYPEDPMLKLKGQYALDLQEAKEQKNTLTLVKSKIGAINPTKTTDKQPTYIIHFKDYDFDLEHWQRLSFSPERYFLSDRDYNLDDTYSQLPWEALKDKKDAIDELAPKTTNWLLKSLGDKETLQTFLECLGLSFLNGQPESMIIFFKSLGGTGKSVLFGKYLEKLFGTENDTAHLDFDQIIKPAGFDASSLRNKSIDLTSDVNATYIPHDAVGLIKALSGNDLRGLPQKYKGVADFANHANLWFNCNDLPTMPSRDFNDSIARRLIIFDWLYIDGFDWDKEKESILKERGELVTKALYYAKQALERPKQHYDYISVPARIYRSHRVITNYKEYENKHNILDKFLAEKCKCGNNYKVGVTTFRTKFYEYAKDNGHIQPITTENVEQQLKEQYSIVKSDKPTSWKHGTQTLTGNYVFCGIAFKEDAGIQDEEREYEEERKRRREASIYIPSSSSEVYSK